MGGVGLPLLENMILMTKKNLRDLIYEAIRSGAILDMPWDYEIKFNDDTGMFEMHCDLDDTCDYSGDMEEIIGHYEDIWKGDEFNYERVCNSVMNEGCVETLDGVEFKLDMPSGRMYADRMGEITWIDGLDDFRKLMEE